MKILYMLFHGFDEASGISKKIMAQIAGLQKANHSVYLCHYERTEDDHRCRMIDNEVVEDYGTGLWAAAKSRCNFDSVVRFVDKHAIDVAYIRSFHNANPGVIHFFKKLRRLGIKVALEIPTYPYDTEYNRMPISWKMVLCVDRIFRYRLAAQCNCIVTFSDAEKIFGQRTVCISNGVDFDETPLAQHLPSTDGSIHLLAVAEIHYWHGFDRAVHGLGLYVQKYPDAPIVFDIVGPNFNHDADVIKKVISQYPNLEKHVFLHGPKHGEELTAFFNKADICIASLARHRSGITKIKTLKNREYAVRGLPFVYSEIDEDFEKMPYVMKAPADETPLDIEALLRFKSHCTIDPKSIRESIRHLDWKVQMKRVLDEL